MASKQFLSFRLGGEYGHFRKYNTTTSPLSYSLPGPTALAGILGAVLGMEREDSKGQVREGQEHLRAAFAERRAQWAVQVIRPVKKAYAAFNLINTASWRTHYRLDGKAHKGRTQIEFELLKEPEYRIFLAWEHPRLEELAERLAHRHHHFTPYLGLSQWTAQLRGEGLVEAQELPATQDWQDCHSAINLSRLPQEGTPLHFGPEQHYHTDTLPLAMNEAREISRYGEVLLETSGQPLQVQGAPLWQVEGTGNFMLL